MISHSTLFRRIGKNGAGMLGVWKYLGGDLTGISKTIYEPSLLVQLWCSVKCRKRINYCATFFYDKNQSQELMDQLDQIGIKAKHSEFKYYNVMKAKLYLEVHEVTALRIMA